MTNGACGQVISHCRCRDVAIYLSIYRHGIYKHKRHCLYLKLKSDFTLSSSAKSKKKNIISILVEIIMPGIILCWIGHRIFYTEIDERTNSCYSSSQVSFSLYFSAACDVAMVK
jgi:hypothetical protein